MPELGNGNQTRVTPDGEIVRIGVDEGPGSGLDADSLDGKHAADFDNATADAQAAADAAQADVNGVLGGPSATPQTLKAWAGAEAFELTDPTDEDDIITGGTVKWPDGSAGTLTVTASTTTGEYASVDAFEVTHDASNQRVVQPEVTRNAAGRITQKPELVVEEIA